MVLPMIGPLAHRRLIISVSMSEGMGCGDVISKFIRGGYILSPITPSTHSSRLWGETFPFSPQFLSDVTIFCGDRASDRSKIDQRSLTPIRRSHNLRLCLDDSPHLMIIDAWRRLSLEHGSALQRR